MAVTAKAICRYNYVHHRVGGSNVSGEINYPPLHNVLHANSRGIKYFKGAQMYQKILFRESKNFNKIEINYPGIQIFQYVWTGGN